MLLQPLTLSLYSNRQVTERVHEKGVPDKNAGLEQRTEGLQARSTETRSLLEIERFFEDMGLHESRERAGPKERELQREANIVALRMGLVFTW
jgi:hypothetical protein